MQLAKPNKISCLDLVRPFRAARFKAAQGVHMRPAKWKLCVQLGQRNIDAFGMLAVWQGGIGKRKTRQAEGDDARRDDFPFWVGGTGTGKCRAYVFAQLPAPATSKYVTRLLNIALVGGLGRTFRHCRWFARFVFVCRACHRICIVLCGR